MDQQTNSEWATGLPDDELEYLEESAALQAQGQVMPGVTSGALIEAMERPEVFAELARGDLYVQMARLRQAANTSRFSVGQHLDYSRLLAKMGKVDTPDSDNMHPSAGLPMISITMADGSNVRLGGTPPPAEKDVTPLDNRG